MVKLATRIAFRFVQATMRSVYDRLPESRRPFGWSTPAPDFRGNPIPPWRTSDKDKAEAFMAHLFPGAEWKDLYVDYESDLHQGRNQLWIGLRDNRDRAEHASRMEQVYETLKKLGYPVRILIGGHSSLYLIDDVKRKG